MDVILYVRGGGGNSINIGRVSDGLYTLMEDDLSVVKDEEGRGGQTYLVITAMAERGHYCVYGHV